MREHKYRAWDKLKKRMSYHVNVYSEGDEWWWAADHVNPDTKDTICSFDDNAGEIMQYTGLKDKNGKEIYEGDIVKSSLRPIGKEIYKVEFLEKEANFTIQNKNVCETNVEIIGNIYEMPELLK